MGGTMRLGADPVKLHDGTRIRELYGEPVVYERHRHRYEVNNHLRRRLESAGLVCSGTSPDERLVEAIELSRDRASVLRRLPVPPGVQVAARAPGAAVPGVRRRRAGARRVAACAPSRACPRRSPACASPRSRGVVSARQRGRARAAARDVRGAVPDREPVGPGARLRRLGHAPSCAAIGLEVERGRQRPGGRVRRRQPARPDPGSRGPSSVLLCAHLDTVPLTAPLEPVLVDGGWENANDGDPRRRQQGRGRGRSWSWPGGSAPRAEPPPVGIELLFTVCEEIGAARRQGVRRRAAAAARSATCSTTPRRSARSSSPRPPTTGSWPSSAAAPPTPASGPRTGAARSLAAAHAIAAMRLGRLDAETTANVGHDRRRHARPTSSPSAAGSRPRCAASTTARAAAVATEMVDHLQDAANAGECDLDVTVERDVRGLPAPSPGRPSWRSPSGRCAPAATSPRRSPPAARRTPTRSSAAGLRRARTWPMAPSTTTSPASGSAPRRSRGCSTSRSRSSTRPRRARGRARRMSTSSSAIGARDKWRGQDRHAPGSSASATPTAPRSTREKVWHPGAVGILAVDDEHVWLTRQPREAAGVRGSLEIPAGKLDVPGEAPLATAPSASWRRRSASRPARWEELEAFYTSPGFSDERVWLFLATDLADADERAEPDEDERIEIVPWPAGRPRRSDRRVRGLQDADRPALARARRRRGDAWPRG